MGHLEVTDYSPLILSLFSTPGTKGQTVETMKGIWIMNTC